MIISAKEASKLVLQYRAKEAEHDKRILDSMLEQTCNLIKEASAKGSYTCLYPNFSREQMKLMGKLKDRLTDLGFCCTTNLGNNPCIDWRPGK
jgi:hypothetical protein